MPATQHESPGLPQYKPTLFVDREEEIACVKKKAVELSLGHTVPRRTVVFRAYKGTGRTWLLRHLERELSRLPGVMAHYISLKTWQHEEPQQALTDIMTHVANLTAVSPLTQVGNTSLSSISSEELDSILRACIRERLAGTALVLLWDYCYEADWQLLEVLEDRVLALLTVEPRVLLVMAGRGPEYPWKQPELRLYAEDYRLRPFGFGVTRQQLAKQMPGAVARAREIFDMSQGYPTGNYLLAAAPTVAEAMQTAAATLLEDLPLQAEERSWLEALCVLRSIADEDQIPVLLAAFYDDLALLKLSEAEAMGRLNRLLQTKLVCWNEEAGGYVVDEHVRPVLEKALQQSRPDVWWRLECAAYRLYQAWAEKYPEERKPWEDQAAYHAKCLSDSGYCSTECP